MYFDTHAHLDDTAFDEDRDEVLLRLKQNGVSCVLDPGCDPESSRKAAAALRLRCLRSMETKTHQHPPDLYCRTVRSKICVYPRKSGDIEA